MRVGSACLVLAIVLAGGALLAPTGRAEHQTDHRYFVTGTITNEFGETLCGVTVRAADIDKPSPDNNRTVTTDGSGSYIIQLHMHDSFDIENNQPRPAHNVNDQILVTVEGSSASSVVRGVKNSGNAEGWGQQKVDLLADGVQTKCLTIVQIGLIGAGIAGAVAAVYAAVWAFGKSGHLGRGSRAGLSEVPGVTRVRARELEGFGIRSVEDLAAAKPEDLSAGTTLTPKQARLLVKRANDALGGKP
jgi:hypothetical protein